ncbi:hypothetical protein B0T18DRAFT_394833 [Schizothecium vesticola]|uniref:Transmembrane protein n=1 Tax=Schizothecium vesticola TaxID=314040 RepID=A0AA40BQT4_9PEZI|nr:hypothetical protein B0T18DRAFT_394833 [Schizothecium vesticola]
MFNPLLTRHATRAACRTAFRRSALPFGLSSGLLLAYQQHAQPMRLDAVPVASRHYAGTRAPDVAPAVKGEERLTLDQFIRQLTAGSMTGFITGLIVSIFSKLLVPLIGLGIVFTQVAAHYGINIVEHIRKKKIQNSRILAALRGYPVFTVVFGTTFFLSSFCSF